jgi:hypothetical protein
VQSRLLDGPDAPRAASSSHLSWSGRTTALEQPF